MAKQPQNPAYKVVENKEIPAEGEGSRAEKGRVDVPDIPQRKHDTVEYQDPNRALHHDRSELAKPADDLGPGLTGSATEVDLANDPKAPRVEVEDGVAREVSSKK